MDYSVHFHTNDSIYEINTYEGKELELKDYIENRSYDEILIMSNSNIWNEIYNDPGISKKDFLPTLYREWNIYWSDKIEEKGGKSEYLEKCKLDSWRKFQVFMECYTSQDAIDLAYDIDDMELYPLVIIAMLKIYTPHDCYFEYCEMEFNNPSDRWESIDLDEENENENEEETDIFYIRELEF